MVFGPVVYFKIVQSRCKRTNVTSQCRKSGQQGLTNKGNRKSGDKVESGERRKNFGGRGKAGLVEVVLLPNSFPLIGVNRKTGRGPLVIV